MSRPVELCSTSAGRSPSSSKVGAALFAACLIAGGILSGLLVGLPETRWFFAGTIGGGVIVAAAIGWWHRWHEHWPGDVPVSLGLTGH